MAERALTNFFISLKKLFKHNIETIFLVFGNALSRIIFLLISFVIIKVAGSEFYGQYALVYNMILVFQVLCTFGLAPIVTKKVANGYNIKKLKFNVLKYIILLSVIIFIIYFILNQFFNIQYLEILSHINLFLFFSAVLSLIFYTILVSVLFGLYERKIIAIFNIINMVIVFIFLTVASLAESINLMVFLFGIANLISGGLVYNYIRKKRLNDGRELKKKELLIESFPIFLSDILVTPIISILLYWLSKSNINEVSIFSVAMQWFGVVLFIPGVLSSLFLSKFSSITNLSVTQYFKSVFINFSLSAAVGIILCILIKLILPLYGEIYVKHILTFVFIIVAGVISSCGTVAGQYLVAKNKQFLCFIFNLIWAVIVLSSSCFLLNYFDSVLGLSIAYIIAYSIHAILQNLYIFIYGRLENA